MLVESTFFEILLHAGFKSMRSTTTKILILATLAAFTLVACEKPNEPKSPKQILPAAPAASAKVSGHAPPGVQPGSHEDWCGGHQVPESLCTRCNPSIIPAFKATGDWCEGHGLPESQCLICNPELKIQRPPQSGEASP
jgi:hypothetical protein